MKRWHLLGAGGLLVVAVALPLVAGCWPIEVNADDVEVTQHDLAFPAVPAVTPAIVLSLSQSFVLDTATVVLSKSFDAQVHVDEVRLHPVRGVSNLDFVRSASVAMADDASAIAPVTVMTFDRATSAAPSGPDLQQSNSQPVDVSAIWSAQHARVQVTVSGTPPTTPWSIDVTVWLSGQFTFH